MSNRAELAKLLDDACLALHRIEGLAVSERNRVEDYVEHARMAVASMVVAAPEAAQQAAGDASDGPVEGSDIPAVSAGTAPQVTASKKAVRKSGRSEV